MFNLINASFIELTHLLTPIIPHWGVGCGFQYQINCDYGDCTGETKFRIHAMTMLAGVGTHMDAPLHCFEGATSIANIPLDQLVSPCVVIDVSSKSHESYTVTVEDIKQYEAMHGEITPNSFVIIHTGWSKHWHDPDKYRNNIIFPAISSDAANYLLHKNIVGLGVDTLSPDGANDGFPVHHLILGAGKYIIENIANADKLPPIGAFVIALPLKIEDGTESPMRLIAVINRNYSA